MAFMYPAFKCYDDEDLCPIYYPDSNDDLDGILIYHIHCSKSCARLIDRIIENTPETSEHYLLTDLECQLAEIKWPAIMIGLYH